MATKSMEAQLQEVIDREEIRTLPVRYCDRVWQKDADGYSKLFTDDGWFATNDPKLPRAEGRANLAKMIAEQGAAAARARVAICKQRACDVRDDESRDTERDPAGLRRRAELRPADHRQ